MRGNGLTAQSYTVVGDVARSHAGDALLALREVGVAAYVVLGDDDRVQVFVDRRALPEARVALQTLSAEPADDIDDVWTQIVAGYDQSAPEPVAEPESRPKPPPSPPSRPNPPTDVSAADLNSRASLEDEGHFVPPVPQPVPRGDLITRLAWGGLIGGPLLLVIATVIGWAMPTEIVMVCLVGFVGGLVTLVVRMKHRHNDDFGGDNGAVL